MIRLKGIHKVYFRGRPGEVTALADVNLRIEKGAYVAVMGPSGSGKTTLLNIIGCLDRPTSGTYWLGGVCIDGMSDVQLARVRNTQIGFVFQAFHLLGDLTALENVELPLIYSNRRNLGHRARKALAAVSLEARMHHKPAELSGGEQQRVATARALVNEPEVLLADEPTGNLDSASGQEILEIFEELHLSGKTIVVVTHDPEVARRAKIIYRMENGKIFKKSASADPWRAALER
ncbi:MAG: ABC transporter ATP-binding protein [Acidobacteriota bacterium]